MRPYMKPRVVGKAWLTWKEGVKGLGSLVDVTRVKMLELKGKYEQCYFVMRYGRLPKAGIGRGFNA